MLKNKWNVIILIEAVLVLVGGGFLAARSFRAEDSEQTSRPAGSGQRGLSARDVEVMELEGTGVSPEPVGTDRPLGHLRDPRIVVIKHRYELQVYDGNRLVKTYRAAVGSRRGDKSREGDRRTPEGRFKVCVKNPQSKFTLSLGLSYPNEEDAGRGLDSGLITQKQHDHIIYCIRNGMRPPWNTPLGGEIMIHGARNGRSGTLGCIALDDDAIRELYPRIDIGTEVIVKP
ncbi:MAG: murein L,D-transpeptidase family protein [Phycisphaerae bacterium]